MNNGYNDKQSQVLSKQLVGLNQNLMECLEDWIKTGKKSDIESQGFSLSGLIDKYRLKYPAALLTLDWIIKEPEKAIPTINKGVK